MHPIKLLAKATAKTVQIGAGGSGGTPLFDSIDAAHALSGLPNHSSQFAYWRFCGDDSQEKRIRTRLLVVCRARAKEKGLRIKAQNMLGLVNVAMTQFMMPLCPKCDGVPMQRVNDDVVMCDACNGTGQKQLKLVDIAQLTEMKRQSFKDNHRELVRDLVAMLKTWEKQVIGHVRDKADL